MDLSAIFIDVSESDKQLLDENHVDITEIITNENFEGTISYEENPIKKELGVNSKDLLPTLMTKLSDPLVIISIGYTINQILKKIYDRPRFVKFIELQELRDKDNNILLDENGKPTYKEILHHELIEPREKKESNNIEISGGKYIIRIGSSIDDKKESQIKKLE